MKTGIILLIIGLAAWTLAGIVGDHISGITATPVAACFFAVVGAYVAVTLSHGSR